MLGYPPGRMRRTSNGRPSCFSKIGAIRATVLESTVGMDPHRSALDMPPPVTCASQSACSSSQPVRKSAASRAQVSASAGEGRVAICGNMVCATCSILAHGCLIAKPMGRVVRLFAGRPQSTSGWPGTGCRHDPRWHGDGAAHVERDAACASDAATAGRVMPEPRHRDIGEAEPVSENWVQGLVRSFLDGKDDGAPRGVRY